MPRRGRTIRVPVAWASRRRGLAEAACVDVDPELFFEPPGAEKAGERRVRETQAKLVCSRCPAFDACRSLVDHIEKNESALNHWGIWAGETPPERARRRWRAAWERRRAG